MNQSNQNNPITVQKVIAIILLVLGAYATYKLLHGLVGIKQIMESRSDRWHYAEEDYYWSNILWARLSFAFRALIILIAGFGLLKNNMYAWAIAWPTCLIVALIGSVSLTIPYADSGIVEIDGRWYRLFFLTVLNSGLTIVMLWPSFWRSLKINWRAISLSIVLLVLLVIDNQFYLHTL